MPYLALVIAALLVGLVIQEGFFQRERRDWTRERQLLLTRIQHPEIVVSSPEERIPDEDHYTSEPDDIDLVGTVVTGTENGDSPS